MKIRKDKSAKSKNGKKKATSEIKCSNFKSVVLGDVTSDSSTEFGQIFADGICDLLEKGDLK